MARNISFALTTEQFKNRTKRVTRRLRWLNLKVGDELMGCSKCQGLKPGEQIERLGMIMVIAVRRERLDRMMTDPEYGKREAIAEGFPEMTGNEFVMMFCVAMGCKPDAEVTRIEFRYMEVVAERCCELQVQAMTSSGFTGWCPVHDGKGKR